MSLGSYIYRIGDYRIEYEIEKHFNGRDIEWQAVICQCIGKGSVLDIPQSFFVDEKEYPVKVIGKKAFLGNRSLREITLPETIAYIDNWAFAQCDNLKKVIILGDNEHSMPKLGKGVFSDCALLEHICVGTAEENTFSALLGTIPSGLQADYLLTDEVAGEREWFIKWDRKLVEFLEEPDEEGYTNLVLCGEEDIQRSVPGYISEKKMLKSKLCLIRLMYNQHLGEERTLFEDYVRSHTKGCDSDEAWQTLLKEYGDDMRYYRLFRELGGIRDEYIDQMIIDMGDRHIEAKAYLLGLKGYASKLDVFDKFVL